MTEQKILEIAKLRPKVNAEAVRCLEEMLERAKSGEIDGVGIAASCNDGCVLTSFTKADSGHVLTSAMATLQWRYLAGRNDDVFKA